MSNEVNKVFERVFIGLGSNLGSRRQNLLRAVEWLKKHPLINVVKVTQFVETEPWGLKDQPRFLNGVAQLSTSLNPEELLVELKRAERELGRVSSVVYWGPRHIDLDILLFDDVIHKTKTLEIPHAHLKERNFVIYQLLDLDENLTCPDDELPLKCYLNK